jgi:hypothetical protein
MWTIMDHQTAGKAQVSQELLEEVPPLGSSHEDVSFPLIIDIETDKQISANDSMHRASGVQQLKTQEPRVAQLYEDTLPTFIYSYNFNSDQLHRTSLVTGVQSSHRVPSYTFKFDCCWSEVPGGSLLITGGGHPEAVRELVRIDIRRECAVVQCAPMLTHRRAHAAVYHSQYLYVMGGYISRYLIESERYVCAANRWETLPPLPRACCNTSGVVVQSSLYALGGTFDGFKPLDLVQKLNLESLTWELMQFRLPFAGMGISCFKLSDTEVYLVVNKTLCSFTSLQVRPLRTLTIDIKSWYGASY